MDSEIVVKAYIVVREPQRYGLRGDVHQENVVCHPPRFSPYILTGQPSQSSTVAHSSVESHVAPCLRLDVPKNQFVEERQRIIDIDTCQAIMSETVQHG